MQTTSFDFTEEDVVKLVKGSIPSIKFSERVKKYLVDAITNTVVTKFWSSGNGYTCLRQGNDNIIKPNGMYMIIDLENRFFLI